MDNLLYLDSKKEHQIPEQNIGVDNHPCNSSTNKVSKKRINTFDKIPFNAGRSLLVKEDPTDAFGFDIKEEVA
jgi:hypothetical protein